MSLFSNVGNFFKSVGSGIADVVGTAGKWLNDNGSTLLNGGLDIAGNILTGNIGGAINAGVGLISSVAAGDVKPSGVGVASIGQKVDNVLDLAGISDSSHNGKEKIYSDNSVFMDSVSGSKKPYWREYDIKTLQTVYGV